MKGGFWSDGVAVSELQAGVATALKAESLAAMLPAIADQIRKLIPAHQSAVSYIPDGDFSRASHATSMSDKYAKYRSYDVMPTGKGIWAKIFEDGQPMRLTEAELYAHTRFKNFDGLKDDRGLEHPPMPGWLAVPVRRSTGQPIGVLQLSDRLEGEFTEQDQEFLADLAALVSPTFELEYVQHELIEARQAYFELYDDAPDMYLSVDPYEGKVLLCNQTAAERLGWPKEELIGRPLRSLYDPACHDAVAAALSLLTEIGHLENVRLAVRSQTGERIPVLLSARAVRDAEGRVTHSVSSWRDISELAAAEALLSQAHAELVRSNDELERFAYVASHDLQEPLRMITSFTELLVDDLGDEMSKERRLWSGFALKGARRMQALIDGLLRYSKAGKDQLRAEPVDLQEVIEQVRTSLSVQVQESAGAIEAEGLPEVVGDPIQLYQVLQNLISNGLRYRSDAPPVVRVTTQRSGDAWEISVSDNGRGIAPEEHDEVFAAFKRLAGAESGSGIGLAIVKRLVERQGGQLSLESTPGAGSTFRFTLPLARPRGAK